MSERRFLHYVFDPARAERAVRFIESCCYLSKGKWAGKRLKLRKWQAEIIRETFGWIDPATGFRRYRKVFIFLSRKNGKSNLAAAIALYCLFGDGEQGAEVVCAANSRDQASIVFNAAAAMVRQSQILHNRAKIIPSTKRILFDETGSILRAVSAEVPTAYGLDISALIYDEIAFATTRELYDALTTAGGSRQQPLQVFITTASWETEGIGHDLYTYAKGVLANPESDPTFLPIIYELPESADWTDEATWGIANPALGDFLQLETLQNEAREAMANTASQGKFLTLHCNRWTQAAESWLDVAKWAEGARPFDEDALRGQPCFLGVDLSSKVDLTAVVALWPLDDGTFYLRPFFFIPDADLRARVLRDHAPYDGWIESRHVTATPGEVVDYSFVRAKIRELAERYEIKAVGYDPWHATQFIQELQADGLECIPIRQGHQSLGAPTKEFESLITAHKLHHDGNPCLVWQIGNVSTRQDANNNIVPCKKKSRQRIDGVVASIMALECSLRIPVFRRPASWDLLEMVAQR